MSGDYCETRFSSEMDEHCSKMSWISLLRQSNDLDRLPLVHLPVKQELQVRPTTTHPFYA